MNIPEENMENFLAMKWLVAGGGGGQLNFFSVGMCRPSFFQK